MTHGTDKIRQPPKITQLRIKTIDLIKGALTLTASLSWLKAFQMLLEKYLPEKLGNLRILGFFAGAIIITVISIIIIQAIDPYSRYVPKPKRKIHLYQNASEDRNV